MYNYDYGYCGSPCASTCENRGGGFAFILVLFILLAIICCCGCGFDEGSSC